MDVQSAFRLLFLNKSAERTHKTSMALSTFVTAVAVALTTLTLYLYRLNSIMFAVPEAVLKVSPHRWTDDEIRETYERVCKTPIDYGKVIPPKLERRYIVVGGSGEYLHSWQGVPRA